MLSYQHIYHAGNFADVQKHTILARLIKTLHLKPARLTVLDTHAGRGTYDLSSEEARKTSEYENGIGSLWPLATSGKPPFGAIGDYLDIVRKYNPDGTLTHYPGTAQIARALLRDQDKLICVEKHPGEFRELQKAMSAYAHNTTLLQEDGFEKLVDLSPLPDRRGLVVIDPSYEIKSEYLDLPRQLEKAWKKWPLGIYMIWYPILQTLGYRHMLSAIRASGIKDVIVSQVMLQHPPKEEYRMQGTGVAIINPPWPENVLNDITQQVAKAMPAKALGKVFWLDNKRISPDTGMLEI